MSLRERANNRAYFYFARRECGRPRNVYYGAGPIAQALADADAVERADRQARAAQRRAMQKRLEEVERHIVQFDQAVDALVRAGFSAHGFHRPGRGAWRRKRENTR